MKIQFGLAVVLTGVLALAAAGDAVARGGGGGGGGGGGDGGGGAVTEPVILSTSVNPCPFDFGTGSCAPVVGTDQAVQITVGVQSDAGDRADLGAAARPDPNSPEW